MPVWWTSIVGVTHLLCMWEMGKLRPRMSRKVNGRSPVITLISWVVVCLLLLKVWVVIIHGTCESSCQNNYLVKLKKSWCPSYCWTLLLWLDMLATPGSLFVDCDEWWIIPSQPWPQRPGRTDVHNIITSGTSASPGLPASAKAFLCCWYLSFLLLNLLLTWSNKSFSFLNVLYI